MTTLNVSGVLGCVAKVGRVPALALILLSTLTTNSIAAATGSTCDRQCLKEFADAYFVALAAHDPSGLHLAPNFKFTENNSVLKLGQGHWKGGGKETYRMQIFDPEQGGVGIEAVIPSATGPAIMVLRLKVENRLLSEAEAVVTYKGGFMFAPENFAGTTPSPYWTRIIRPAERNSRYELLGVAEAYWRAFQTEGTPEYIRAPLLPDTIRTENGKQTTNTTFSAASLPPELVPKGTTPPPGGIPTGTAAEQFDKGAFKGMILAERRYPVVDEEVGAVLSFARFGVAPDARIVGEFFAVTQGKIPLIAAVFTEPTTPGPTPWH